MSTQQPIVKRPGTCNGNGHPPDCTCGWGGVYYGCSAPPENRSIPPAGTRAVWDHADFCRPSTCPKCRQSVFFVRHNGGSVWFDSLGQPWPKHPCMATEPDMAWIQTRFADDLEPGNRMVFGVVREARVTDPGINAFFVIACSDGTVIEDQLVFTRNPCEAVGGLVKLELSADNRIGQRRFKLIDDIRAADEAMSARRKRRESEEVERQEILRPLLEENRRKAKGMLGVFYDKESERLVKMSLRSLKKLIEQRRRAEGEKETS